MTLPLTICKAGGAKQMVFKSMWCPLALAFLSSFDHLGLERRWNWYKVNLHMEGLNLHFKLPPAAFWVTLNCWVCGLSLTFCSGACPAAFSGSGGEGPSQRSVRGTKKFSGAVTVVPMPPGVPRLDVVEAVCFL